MLTTIPEVEGLVLEAALESDRRITETAGVGRYRTSSFHDTDSLQGSYETGYGGRPSGPSPGRYHDAPPAPASVSEDRLEQALRVQQVRSSTFWPF